MTDHHRDDNGRRYATVNTGRPDDIFVGARLLWLHAPRGGYGFTVAIPAKVLRYSARSGDAVIEVLAHAGARVKRRVGIGSLRWST